MTDYKQTPPDIAGDRAPSVNRNVRRSYSKRQGDMFVIVVCCVAVGFILGYLVGAQ